MIIIKCGVLTNNYLISHPKKHYTYGRCGCSPEFHYFFRTTIKIRSQNHSVVFVYIFTFEIDLKLIFFACITPAKQTTALISFYAIPSIAFYKIYLAKAPEL